MNDFVSHTLTEATKDVVTEEEMEEERRKTREFLSACAGSWNGPESADDIINTIKEGRTTRRPLSL